jgi:glutathione S-transferase
MLRLYHHPFSTFGRRVRVALLEKKIEHESIVLDMTNRAHKAPEYLALNPYGRVPTIDDDGFVLYESAAILEYLEATRPKPALTPADARGRALVDMHLRLCDLQMARPAGAIVFPKRFLPKEKWDAAAIAQAKGEIEKHLAIVETTLGNREYLVGEAFSLADIAYLPFLHFLPLMEIEPGPRVAAWAKRLLARPSAQATVPER